MAGLADVDGFELFIQVCVWPRFPPLLISVVKVGMFRVLCGGVNVFN